MFSNYFFLKRLTTALGTKIKGLELIACFSQNKDELILGFASEVAEFWIRANLDPNISMLSFPISVPRARRNSVDLFKPITGIKVESTSIFKFERSFKVSFENDQSLIFKMHGRRANVLLADSNHVIEIFRNSLSSDLALIPDELNKEIDLSPSSFAQCDFNPTTLLPALGKEIQKYWDANFSSLDDQDKWTQFEKLLVELDTNPIYLNEEDININLTPTPNSLETRDPIEASNWLYTKKIRDFYFEREKNQSLNQLKQQIKKSENYIFKTSEKLRLIKAQRNPEEIANILMANLALVKTGLSQVVLNDFYQNDFLEIKLNPKLSPQKNAENLYRKSKNRHQEISALEQNIAEKEKRIKSINKQIAQLEEVDNSKKLKEFNKKNKLKNEPRSQTRNDPYHEFELDGWKILVGKNAKANDELTLKIATKNDLWLHAKDVSGSHVIIKQHPGQNFPIDVIEYAASLAAYNSKRKTDTLCPVVYTPKKYVRKPKGSLPGVVIVEKEEVLMIEPSEG
jgi:predicted ribosome quality control (RQC) complex YloA/Tae2 family protein